MGIRKLTGALALFVLVSVPFFAGAEDYVSPSVMRIGQNSAAPEQLNYSNYSYTDRPFDGVVSKVGAGYFLSGEDVVYQLVINVTNQNGRFVSINSVPSYCKIGSNDCKKFSCNYYSNQMDLQPSESKQAYCTITAGECAGREIVIEYTAQGVKGSVATENIVKCPQKFCDQVTSSMNAPKISYVGDRIFVEGYLSFIGGGGLSSPVLVSAGRYHANTSSNDFGYWKAPIEIDTPGSYEISAISESCARESKSSIQVLETEEKPFSHALSVYPKNLDVEIGGSALLAVQNNGNENVAVSLSGIPPDWVEPSKFSIGNGIKFIYVSPKSTGGYVIKINDGYGENYVNLFVAGKDGRKSAEADNLPAFFVLVAGAFLLFGTKKTGTGVNKKSGYLDEVKKEIENSAGSF